MAHFGHKQWQMQANRVHMHTNEDTAASPTISTKAILMTMAMNAMEERDVTTADAHNTFAETEKAMRQQQ